MIKKTGTVTISDSKFEITGFEFEGPEYGHELRMWLIRRIHQAMSEKMREGQRNRIGPGIPIPAAPRKDR